MQKLIYTASSTLFTFSLTAEADRVFCQLVMFFTVFFHWMLKMKYSCYQQSSLIHGWFVYWIFGREMRRLPKLEIRFRMHRFRFYLAGCGLKSPSSDSGLTYIAFKSCISNGKPKQLLYTVYVCFFISYFMKSSAVYEANLCTFVLRSETMIWSSIYKLTEL